MNATIAVLKTIADANGGIVTTEEALRAGTNRVTLKRYADKGVLTRIARGQYTMTGLFQTSLRFCKAEARILSTLTAVPCTFGDCQTERHTFLNSVCRKDITPVASKNAIPIFGFTMLKEVFTV